MGRASVLPGTTVFVHDNNRQRHRHIGNMFLDECMPQTVERPRRPIGRVMPPIGSRYLGPNIAIDAEWGP